jgi:hypothetical protein
MAKIQLFNWSIRYAQGIFYCKREFTLNLRNVQLQRIASRDIAGLGACAFLIGWRGYR